MTNLAIFSTFHFLEGGVSGLFWAILQSYTLIALRDGPEARNTYLAGYNLGWNSGVIAGYILGALLVFFTGTNESVFWANFVTSVVIAIIIFAAVKESSEDSKGIVVAKGLGVIEGKNPAQTREITDIFPPAFIFILLLVHSFADGALLVLGPLKIAALALSSPFVYVLSLAKYACQTVTSTLGAKIKEKDIPRAFQICPLVIAAAWAVIGITPEFVSTIIAATVSGAAQGVLYAVGLKTISNYAQKTGKTQYFSIFQITQGGGRGIGPFVMGYVGAWDFMAGTGIIVAFGTVMGCAAIAKQHLRRI
jgi:MFS family permease